MLGLRRFLMLQVPLSATYLECSFCPFFGGQLKTFPTTLMRLKASGRRIPTISPKSERMSLQVLQVSLLIRKLASSIRVRVPHIEPDPEELTFILRQPIHAYIAIAIIEKRGRFLYMLKVPLRASYLENTFCPHHRVMEAN